MSSTLSSFFALCLGIMLAKLHSGHISHLTTPLINLLPSCNLNTICPWYASRPQLPDGRPSSRIWDIPRRHLLANFSALPALSPGVTLSHEWRAPRIIVLDGVPGAEFVHRRLRLGTSGNWTRAAGMDQDGKIVHDKGRNADVIDLDCHSSDENVNALVNGIVRLAGFPGRHYAEMAEISRYNESASFEMHHDVLPDHDLATEDSPFQGCQRAATAMLHVTDVAQGGECAFVKDANFRGGLGAVDTEKGRHVLVKPKMGRLVVLYNMDPMTEMADSETWQGSMAVLKGVKILVTVYIRNCSMIENERRLRMRRGVVEESPQSSTQVEESVEEEVEESEDVDVGDDLDMDDERLNYKYERELYLAIKNDDSDGKNVTLELIKAGFDPVEDEAYYEADLFGEEEDAEQQGEEEGEEEEEEGKEGEEQEEEEEEVDDELASSLQGMYNESADWISPQVWDTEEDSEDFDTQTFHPAEQVDDTLNEEAPEHDEYARHDQHDTLEGRAQEAEQGKEDL